MSSQDFISRRFDCTTAIFFKGDAFWTKLTLQCYIGNKPVTSHMPKGSVTLRESFYNNQHFPTIIIEEKSQKHRGFIMFILFMKNQWAGACKSHYCALYRSRPACAAWSEPSLGNPKRPLHTEKTVKNKIYIKKYTRHPLNLEWTRPVDKDRQVH